MHIRCDQQIPGLGQRNGLQALTNAFSKGGKTAHENRYIGTQTKTDFGELIVVKVQLPQTVQCVQRGGRVRAAATQTGTTTIA